MVQPHDSISTGVSPYLHETPDTRHSTLDTRHSAKRDGGTLDTAATSRRHNLRRALDGTAAFMDYNCPKALCILLDKIVGRKQEQTK